MLEVETEHATDPAGFRAAPSVNEPPIRGSQDVPALVAVLDHLLGQVVTL
jgi:hypothetical protein